MSIFLYKMSIECNLHSSPVVIALMVMWNLTVVPTHGSILMLWMVCVVKENTSIFFEEWVLSVICGHNAINH